MESLMIVLPYIDVFLKHKIFETFFTIGRVEVVSAHAQNITIHTVLSQVLYAKKVWYYSKPVYVYHLKITDQIN
jgi:hypothetical protein